MTQIVVANQNTVDVSLGVGHGEFLPKQTYTIAPVSNIISGRAVAVGDFNGDGKLDIAAAMEGAPGEVLVAGHELCRSADEKLGTLHGLQLRAEEQVPRSTRRRFW